MRLAPAVAGLVVSLTAVSKGAGEPTPKRITGTTVAAIQSWVQAVKTHTPGRADDPVVAVAALSYDAREELNAGMALFLRALMAKTYNAEGNAAAKVIVAIGHAAGNPDANGYLKRAAILHADVAAYGDRFPVRSTRVAEAAPRRTEQRQSASGLPTTSIASPLLATDTLILHYDGQVLGEVVGNWNWPFARSLLDLVDAGPAGKLVAGGPRPKSATDPFVSAWYHATTAYMFASGLYGYATAHLQHAAGVLPDDALVLFDRGCYAEILGLPIHQALSSERDIAGEHADHRYGGASQTWTPPGSTPALYIPSVEKTNAEAERLYRRALAIDPSLVEARVRLARLLDLRQRHDEAAAELNRAISANPSEAVAYYAHLFAGRAAQARGLPDEASRHYQDALALFPDAQSALLASSQLALLGADVPAALAPVRRLGARSPAFTADPWWQYHLGAGRDAEDLLKALWASVPR